MLGQPVTRQDERAGRRCITTPHPLVFVDLELDRESAAESWKGINAGNAMIGADHEKLSGIGEQAVFGPRDRLYVLSGDAFWLSRLVSTMLYARGPRRWPLLS